MEDRLLPCVIADSAAFLKNAPLEKMGTRIFTIPDVISEIRDANTRQRLSVLPYTIEFREPSCESIKAVSDFAKKTGDFSSLSAVDIRVMALTYQLEKEFCNSEHIKTQPVHSVEYVKGNGMANIANIPGLFYDGKKHLKPEELNGEDGSMALHGDADMGTEEGESDKNVNDKQEELSKQCQEDTVGDDLTEECKEDEEKVRDDEEFDEEDCDENQNEEERVDDEDQDDGGGWITPNNISKLKKEIGCEDEVDCNEVDMKSACLTTDFAMQNVLIQMGLHVVSLNGMMIKQARSYILKCYGCNKETTIMDKVFCPNCGNRTLKRVSVSVKNGTIQYHLPRRRRPMNIRGTKYPLPLPKGGRNAENVILCEDQKQSRERLPKSRDVANPLDLDYIARSSPFTQKDVTSKAFNKGLHLNKNTRKNPNEGRRTKSRRK
eukprot:gene18759-20650_t